MNRHSDSTRWCDALPYADLARRSEALPERFYARPAAEVARDLLGKILVHGETAGRIVETEAYLGAEDLAAHSSKGITERTRVIFGPPGRAYVYLIYGMYECFNIVTEPAGTPGCVLLRALEPLCGVSRMRERRPAAKSPRDLASGPAKLTLALGITRAHYGRALMQGDLSVRRLLPEERVEILATPRIGIRECAGWPLRFVLAGSDFLSR
jgi:DNA-3-methyladenine glycosylase